MSGTTDLSITIYKFFFYNNKKNTKLPFGFLKILQVQFYSIMLFCLYNIQLSLKIIILLGDLSLK